MTTRESATEWEFDMGSQPDDAGVEGESSAHRFTVTATDHGGANGDGVRISGSTDKDFDYEYADIQDVVANVSFTIGGANLQTAPGDQTSIAAYVYVRDADAPILPDTIGSVSVIDDYAVFTKKFTDKFWVSIASDATTIKAVAFATAEAKGDDVIRSVEFNGNNYFFGDGSLEVWYDAGLTPEPLAPSKNATMSIGLVAFNSVANVSGKYLIFVSKSTSGELAVTMLDAYNPTNIANGAVLEALRSASLAELTAIYSFAFQLLGRDMYAITIAERTFVCNITDSKKAGTFLWWEWESQDGNRWLAKYYAYFNGKHLVSDPENARIYELDLDTYVEHIAGTDYAITRTGTSGYIHADDKGMMHNRVHVDVASNETGGTLSLEYSDDGGHNWKQAGSKTWTGFSSRLEWFADELGGFTRTDRLYRISTSTQSKLLILGAYADVEACDW